MFLHFDGGVSCLGGGGSLASSVFGCWRCVHEFTAAPAKRASFLLPLKITTQERERGTTRSGQELPPATQRKTGGGEGGNAKGRETNLAAAQEDRLLEADAPHVLHVLRPVVDAFRGHGRECRQELLDATCHDRLKGMSRAASDSIKDLCLHYKVRYEG